VKQSGDEVVASYPALGAGIKRGFIGEFQGYCPSVDTSELACERDSVKSKYSSTQPPPLNATARRRRISRSMSKRIGTVIAMASDFE
jgi:hypothetical protein